MNDAKGTNLRDPNERWLEAVAPSDYRNPKPAEKYHLVVVGAGPAGLIAAIGAAGLGARVALVERHRMGGDCLNVGCVPSKALLEYAAHAPSPDFAGAFAHMRSVRAGIATHDSIARYTDAGVDVFVGHAAFQDAHALRVGDLTLRGRRFVVCTGARASVPPIPGLADADPLTNETLFDLERAPRSLGILGAGAIGCEMAQAFARLGVTVHLFEMAPRVLPLEIEEAGTILADALSGDGVTLHLGAPVESVTKNDSGSAIRVDGSAPVDVDRVLVALGRRPNTDDLGLERAGVRVNDKGLIDVDSKLRTTRKRIYAAGDCASVQQFTHVADAQAKVVIQNALFAPTASMPMDHVPHCTYTSPEVATLGSNRNQLADAGTEFDSYRVDFRDLDRGRTQLDDGGFAEVWCRQGSDRILGATVVGRDAGELLAPLGVLVSQGAGLKAANGALLSYPTRSEYLKNLALQYNRSRLSPRVQALFRRWFAWTG